MMFMTRKGYAKYFDKNRYKYEYEYLLRSPTKHAYS